MIVLHAVERSAIGASCGAIGVTHQAIAGRHHMGGDFAGRNAPVMARAAGWRGWCCSRERGIGPWAVRKTGAQEGGVTGGIDVARLTV